MNIACSSCPAKYAIPDEKVRGRKVRITCKRCGAAIIVDGSDLPPASAATADASAPTSAATAAVPSERTRQRTILGGLRAPVDSAPGAPVSQPPPPAAAAPQVTLPKPAATPKTGGFPSPAKAGAPDQAGAAAPRPAPEPKWTVAVTDDDHREMTMAEVVDAYAASTIDKETFIWRDGMDDWLGPFEIPDIAAALGAKGLVPRTNAAASAPAADEPRPRQPSGSWTEPGRWDHASPPVDGPNPAFDDVTVAMAAPQAQELLDAAASGESAATPSGVTVDALGLGQGDEEAPRQAAPRPAAGEPAPFRLPFEEPAPAAAPVLPAAEPPPPAESKDLFGDAGAPEAPAPRPRMRSIPPEPGGPQGSLTGARNESSVLFSLDQLVGKHAAQKAPPRRAEKLEAEALLLGGPPGGGDDAPPSVANLGGGALFSAAAMAAPDFNAPPPPSVPHHPTPSTAPSVAVSEGSSKTGLWVTLGLVALLGAGGAAFVLLKPAAAPSPDAAATATPLAAPAAPAETVAAVVTASAPAQPAEAPAAPSPSAGAPEPAAAPAAVASGATPAAHASSAPAAAPAAAAPAAKPASAPAGAPAAAPAAPNPAAPEPAAAPAADGPEFNKEAAATALAAAVAQAQTECASQEGTHGTGKVQITFMNSGRATNALVSGDFAGSALGGCVARVFRGVKVPAFSGDPVRVNKTVRVP